MPAKRLLDHLPLHRVGVLELVDQHDTPVLLHPVAGRRVLWGKGFGEPVKQVVVSKNALTAFTAIHFVEDILCEPQPHVRGGIRVWFLGAQLSARVADNRLGHRECVLASQRRGGLLLSEVRKVAVVDDLAHQIVQILHQSDTRIRITGHAKRFQYQRTELVDGDDCRFVEAGQRITQPCSLFETNLLGGIKQVHFQVVARLTATLEDRQRVDDLAAHPLPQLAAGHPPEGDHQHLVKGGFAFGQVAGGKAGQCERFSGACAGL